MAAPSRSWERQLLTWANEGLEQELSSEPVTEDARLLDRAYAHCDAMARQHSRTFYKASSLLPSARRRSIRALYAFCRITDDLIDHAQGDREANLAAWQARALSVPPPSDDLAAGDSLVAMAWADTRLRCRIPARYAGQLIQGVARDLTTTRYATFDDLAAYCYGVASTVGLMSMHIIGFTGRDAIPYAVKLGVTLQVTNILRDVREDWEAGRVYLPQEELAAFGLSDDDIAARVAVGGTRGQTDGRWRAFMRFQVARNRELYAEATPGIARLDPAGRFAVAAATALYRDILDDIAAHDGDVFSRRASPSTRRALPRAVALWWPSSRPHDREQAWTISPANAPALEYRTTD